MAEKLCTLRKYGGGRLRRVVIGSSNSAAARTFDVKAILPNVYSQLTIDNFAVLAGSCFSNYNNTANTADLFNSYDSQTGILSTNLVSNYSTTANNSQSYYFTVLCFY